MWGGVTEQSHARAGAINRILLSGFKRKGAKTRKKKF